MAERYKEETPQEVTLFGFPYMKVVMVGLAIALLSMVAIWFSFEDREQRNTFFFLSSLNVVCLGLTWFMKNSLTKSRQKRLEENKRKQAWNQMP